MSRSQKIKSLASLEKEIYRLKLESRKYEYKLEKNLKEILENVPSLIIRTIFRERSSKNKNGPGFSRPRPDFSSIFEQMADHISQKAVDGVSGLVSRLFSKQK